MLEVRDIVQKVRSKNAGPFWLTVDIFCGSEDAFEKTRAGLHSSAVAKAFDMPEQLVKRFDIADLYVIKFSVPRPDVQGTRSDRDMHGAAAANLIAELEIE